MYLMFYMLSFIIEFMRVCSAAIQSNIEILNSSYMLAGIKGTGTLIQSFFNLQRYAIFLKPQNVVLTGVSINDDGNYIL